MANEFVATTTIDDEERFIIIVVNVDPRSFMKTSEPLTETAFRDDLRGRGLDETEISAKVHAARTARL